MDQDEIIRQTYFLYSNDRKNLVEKLRTFDWKSAILSKICETICTEIKRPIHARGDLYEPTKLNDFRDEFGDTKTGDISDRYTINSNQDINEVIDWDFTDFINNDKEVRCIKIWVNWFLPIYYLEVQYQKSIENGNKIELGSLDKLSQYEQTIIKKIEAIFTNFKFQFS